jgi:hypothetical protein
MADEPFKATDKDWAYIEWAGGLTTGCMSRTIRELRDRVAALEAERVAPEADAVLSLAAIIRSVDGAHNLGATALAEAILSHPDATTLRRAIREPAACPHIRSNGDSNWCALAEQQAAPELDAQPEPNQAPAADHFPAATKMVPAGDGGLVEVVLDAMGEGTEVEARAAIRAVAKWLRSRGDHGSAATKMVPAGDGEREELADRLGWIAAQLFDIGWEGDSASVARAAALLRQPAPVPVSEPVAWLWEYIGSDLYTKRHSPVARSLREMDPSNPPYPETWKPIAPLYDIPQPPQGEEAQR